MGKHWPHYDRQWSQNKMEHFPMILFNSMTMFAHTQPMQFKIAFKILCGCPQSSLCLHSRLFTLWFHNVCELKKGLREQQFQSENGVKEAIRKMVLRTSSGF